MKSPKFIKTTLLVCICCAVIAAGEHAYSGDDRVQIVYAGTTFAGGDLKSIERRFAPLISDRDSDSKRLREIVERNIQKYRLPFDLISPSGVDKKREYRHVENPLSLTVLITRATVFKDTYRLQIRQRVMEYHKYYFDLGLSAIFFTPAGNKDKIEYAIPVIAEDIFLKKFSRDQIKDQFFKTFQRALEILFGRLEKLNPRLVKAKVIKISGGVVRIDAGKKNDVLQGAFTKFKEDGLAIVTRVKKHSADIELIKGRLNKGDMVRINILKSEKDDTYQVIDVKITSKNAKKIFGRNADFKVLCAQWFSDYLSDRGNRIVLPPKTGSRYSAEAKSKLISAYDLTGGHFNFEIASAVNPIILNITGLNKKMYKGGSINQIWIYKAWVEKNINGKKKEVSEFVKEEVILGVKEIDDYQVFWETIQQTLAKLSIN